MNTGTAESSRAVRRWKLLHWVVVTAVVVILIAPLLRHPQLTADDYRYLDHVQDMRGDFVQGFLRGAVVENRWDHLWWIAPRDPVRFYRPVVVLSYWFDGLLHGGPSARGLVLSNGLLHLLCSWLVMVLLWRWFQPGLASLLGASLFAAFYCHGEVLWYVAGRTDSLAVLGFLAGLALHGVQGRMRWFALPCYAMALLSKELTVCLPVVALLGEQWLGRDTAHRGSWREVLSRDRNLYVGYAITAVAVFLLRAAMLGDARANLSEPYLIAPTQPGFGEHLWMQLRSYGENLTLATRTRPFMQPSELANNSSGFGLGLTIGAIGAGLWLVIRDRRARWFAVLALLAWLPTSIVYLSERYLYLPSFAVAGLLVVLLDRCGVGRSGGSSSGAGRARAWIALIVAIAWVLHQGGSLWNAHRDRADDPPLAESITRQLDELASPIPRGASVYLLNFPANWVTAQFAEATFRVHYNDPTLQVTVMTVTPIHPTLGNAASLRDTSDGLVLRGASDGQGRQAPVIARGAERFPWRDLETGEQVALAERLEVEVLRGRDSHAEELRFRLPVPLSEAVLLRWAPAPEGPDPLTRLRQSKVARLAP